MENTFNPQERITSDWINRLANAIPNMSTQGVTIAFIAIGIFIVLVILAILLPLLLSSSRNNAMETRISP